MPRMEPVEMDARHTGVGVARAAAAGAAGRARCATAA